MLELGTANNAAFLYDCKACQKHYCRWICELPSAASGITADLKEFIPLL
jgi:hypothetical protein